MRFAIQLVCFALRICAPALVALGECTMSAFDIYVGFVTTWAVLATLLTMRYCKIASDALRWNARFNEATQLRRSALREPVRQWLRHHECWN